MEEILLVSASHPYACAILKETRDAEVLDFRRRHIKLYLNRATLGLEFNFLQSLTFKLLVTFEERYPPYYIRERYPSFKVDVK